MDFNYCFRKVGLRDINLLRDFLLNQNLGYPNYESWVDKAIGELDNGSKKGVLAFSNSILVGNLIYQDHKEFEGVLELKNLRVDSRFRGRYFARFMLKQVEYEEAFRHKLFIGDVRENQEDMIKAMITAGYRTLCSLNLYENTARDLIMVKSFS